MRVALTVDTEQDCPPFLNTYRGITEGLPRLVELLDQKNIKATFFVTGEIAEKFPATIDMLVKKGHEIGCHGNTHARLDKIGLALAREEIISATNVLRKFFPVTSFRAPNLQLPKELLPLLKELGYKIDSTQARHKKLFLRKKVPGTFLRLPVTTTSIILRMPRSIREWFLRRFKDPVILMVHPWEFVDLRKEKIRLDCKFRTGDTTLKAISETIDFFSAKGANFFRINEFNL